MSAGFIAGLVFVGIYGATFAGVIYYMWKYAYKD